jgi:ribosomal protein S18 acetylase RimI-like enzyme
MSSATTPVIRSARPEDLDAVLALYRAVAARPGGLARESDEISRDYIAHIQRQCREHGLSLVATDGPRVVGEIHAYGRGIRTFAHVLGDLTIAVHPDAQGRGIGRLLFTHLLGQVIEDFPAIVRVELVARESNAHAIALYESLGFRREGRFEARVCSVNGGLEADIPMAWMRPAASR